MINTVRNTVLSILNKNNYGYLSPSDFNLFSKQAQLEIFESYFSQYNTQINKENVRLSGTGIANLSKSIEESMDLFSMTKGLNINSSIAGSYFMPSITTTGDDYYFVNKVLVYKDIIVSGSTSSFNALGTRLIDSSATFIAAGVVVGDIVAVEGVKGVAYGTVTIVTSETELTTSSDVFTLVGLSYTIIKAGTQQNEAEKVTHSKITMLNNSIYTAPSTTYPSYTSEEELLQIYPNTISTAGRAVAQYFRYPKTPKWTYISVGTGGDPIFDQSQADYQDFEIPLDDENNLIMTILKYAGISIREADVYTFAKAAEAKENQQEAG